MRLKLVAEIAQRRRYRIKAQLPVSAQRPGLHILPDVPHQRQVVLRPFQPADAFQHFQQVAHPHSAGEALAAGFVLAEGNQVAGQINHAGILIGHDDAAGTQNCPRRTEHIKIQRQIQVGVAGRQHAPQRAASLQQLHPLAAGDAAGHIKQHLPQRHPQRHLHQPGVGNVAGQAQDGRAAAAVNAPVPVRRRADAGEPRAAPRHNLRHIGQRFYIINVGRLAEHPHLRRKRRAVAGH